MLFISLFMNNNNKCYVEPHFSSEADQLSRTSTDGGSHMSKYFQLDTCFSFPSNRLAPPSTSMSSLGEGWSFAGSGSVWLILSSEGHWLSSFCWNRHRTDINRSRYPTVHVSWRLIAFQILSSNIEMRKSLENQSFFPLPNEPIKVE